MYGSVAAALLPFDTTFEGSVPWMYLDDLGIVTTAIGLNIDNGDTISAAGLSFPWTHGDGGPAATPAEIQAAYTAVKSRQDLKGIGGGNDQFAQLSDLRLSQDAQAKAAAAKAAQNEPILASYFPNYYDLQADWQLLLHSMAWAVGAAFSEKFPKFTAAINAPVPDAEQVQLQAWIEDSSAGVPQTYEELQSWLNGNAPSPDTNPGLRPRNIANQLLARNGAAAMQSNEPYSTLWWPNTSPTSTGGGNGPGGVSTGLKVAIVGGAILAAGALAVMMSPKLESDVLRYGRKVGVL